MSGLISDKFPARPSLPHRHREFFPVGNCGRFLGEVFCFGEHSRFVLEACGLAVQLVSAAQTKTWHGHQRHRLGE